MTRAAQTPRRAFVFGGGGVLGFAWMLGALTALQIEADFDARDVQLAVGTSAGSVAAALLGCGLSVDVISRHHEGIPGPADPSLAYDYATASGRGTPPRPGWRPGSPRLLLDGVLHPRRISPMVTLTGLLPAGRGSLQPVHELVRGVAAGAGFASAWPDAPRPWVVAADYRTGRRIVFGRDQLAPAADGDGHQRVVRRASLADAVWASCSIPGWYPPVVIDGVPYIDGGAVSNASVDVVQHAAVDEVFVLAPMASLEPDRPATAVARLERRVRRAITRRIVEDAAMLRSVGIRVCVVTPGVADLAAMGVNLMDPSRRSEVFETARESAADQVHRQLAASGGWGRRAGTGRTPRGRA